MKNMSDADLLALALRALPERLQKLDGRVLRHGAALRHAPQAESTGEDPDTALLAELSRMLEIDLSPMSPDASADVEYLEKTALGTRATVVQIRDGKVARIIGQASLDPAETPTPAGDDARR